MSRTLQQRILDYKPGNRGCVVVFNTWPEVFLKNINYFILEDMGMFKNCLV